MTQRIAIVGTAQSWKRAPWNDPGCEIWSLNDAYRLKGFARADRWFDLHPFDHFWFAPPDARKIDGKQIPVGHYVRPDGYLDWLAQLQIPLYLQDAPPDGFGPQAQRYPKETIEASFGRYFTSTPAWMLALAVSEGIREIAIYGIHLATEHEYIEQRPNFEYLIGRVLGTGAVTTTVADGLRHYESPNGHVILPVDAPILQSDFQYAYQTRPRAKLLPHQIEVAELSQQRERLVRKVLNAPWYRPMSSTRAELQYVEAALIDAQQALSRVSLSLGG